MSKQTRTAGERLKEYNDEFLRKVSELIGDVDDSEYCFECNSPLSDCGDPNVDGTPSKDCQVCQLRERLAVLRKQALTVHAAVYSFYGDSVKYPQLMLPEHQQQQLERILVDVRTLIKL